MSRTARALTSAVLLFHLTAVVGSLAIGTPPGDAIREHTRGYERLVGVYQGWSMFAPNPPIVDRWMVITGEREDGEEIRVPSLMGARDDVVVEWRYQRAGKLERNLMSGSRRKALRDYTRWLCGQHDLARIRVVKVSRRTPSPADRQLGVPFSITHETLRDERCR